MHHLDGAAGETKGHGPDGTAACPVHEIVYLGDHELRGLGEARWRGRGRRGWSPRIRSRTVAGAGAGREGREGGVEGEDTLSRERQRKAPRGSCQESHGRAQRNEESVPDRGRPIIDFTNQPTTIWVVTKNKGTEPMSWIRYRVGSV